MWAERSRRVTPCSSPTPIASPAFFRVDVRLNTAVDGICASDRTVSYIDPGERPVHAHLRSPDSRHRHGSDRATDRRARQPEHLLLPDRTGCGRDHAAPLATAAARDGRRTLPQRQGGRLSGAGHRRRLHRPRMRRAADAEGLPNHRRGSARPTHGTARQGDGTSRSSWSCEMRVPRSFSTTASLVSRAPVTARRRS